MQSYSSRDSAAKWFCSSDPCFGWPHRSYLMLGLIGNGASCLDQSSRQSIQAELLHKLSSHSNERLCTVSLLPSHLLCRDVDRLMHPIRIRSQMLWHCLDNRLGRDCALNVFGRSTFWWRQSCGLLTK